MDSDGLAVTSQYFRVRSEVRLGERRQLLWSTLQRQADGPGRGYCSVILASRCTACSRPP